MARYRGPQSKISRRFGEPIVVDHKPSGKKLYIVVVQWNPNTLNASQNAEEIINDTSGSFTTDENDDNTLNVTNDESEYSSDSGSSSAADF